MIPFIECIRGLIKYICVFLQEKQQSFEIPISGDNLNLIYADNQHGMNTAANPRKGSIG